MDNEIAVRIMELASKQVGVEPSQVTRESHFRNDLGYDSLDEVEFGMTLEDEYSLSIPDAEIERFQTVGKVIDYVEEHVRDATSSRR